MDKNTLISNILSGDQARIAEAKGALKEMLSAKASAFKNDVQRFVTKKLFENHISDYGPFEKGCVVQDKVKGICGVVDVDPHNSGHAVTVHLEDNTTCVYGPEEIKNLVKHQGEMSDIIDMLVGKVKGA